jgi:hypothetical protein
MKKYKCEKCGTMYHWGEMHDHFNDEKEENLQKLVEFLVDIEDIAVEKGISTFSSIPEVLFDNCWSVFFRFEVGRNE